MLKLHSYNVTEFLSQYNVPDELLEFLRSYTELDVDIQINPEGYEPGVYLWVGNEGKSIVLVKVNDDIFFSEIGQCWYRNKLRDKSPSMIQDGVIQFATKLQ